MTPSTNHRAQVSQIDDPSLAELVEELTNQLHQGTSLDLEAYLAAHPRHAEQLQQLLPTLQVLAGLSEPGNGRRAAPSATGAAGLVGGTLGDFRIIREAGRGGMGIVYEAEQLSLKRRVALKALPFASTLDPRHLQRFQNEAQAAASLHHTNIVPVYRVGCERGVHYYAMQFIDGQPLDALIAQLRRSAGRETLPAAGATALNPAATSATGTETPLATALSTERAGRRREYYRTVAHWAVQAAEALDHAHQLGVVHRDIKPGNLLVESKGQLWVTDFGLARTQSAASLTSTGDLVGTLRYMSPEQALAQRVVIDHRTDIYSLGATLYELLTLRPVFEGTDRQELLRQIAFDDPPPPRRLNRSIPVELEIIARKAMEKRPIDRYTTAKELADDLRRYLEGRPIQARRPSWRQAGVRWACRHRPLVTAVGVVALVTALLGSSTWLWWTEKRVRAEGEAGAALQEAVRWQQEERWTEALSAIRQARGVLAGLGADASLQEQIDQRGQDLEMARRLEEARLQGAAAMKDNVFDGRAIDEAYKAAFQWYGLDVDALEPAEAAERAHRSSISMQLVAALDEWMVVRWSLGIHGADQLLAVARAADPDPWRNRLRDAVGKKDPKVLEELAASARSEDLPPPTAVLLCMLGRRVGPTQETTAVLRQVQQRHPADFWVNENLGLSYALMRPPRLEEALCYFTAAVALRPHSPGAHVNRGMMLQHLGQFDEAIAELRQAIALQEDYVAVHHNLGNALKEQGKLDEAMAAYRESLRLQDRAEAHHGLASALRLKGQLDEALAECHEAIRLRSDFAEAHSTLGNVLSAKGRKDEAIAEHHEAIRITANNPEAHNNLGIVLKDQGQLDAAIAEYQTAIQLRENFADAHNNLGVVLMMKGQLDEAVAEFRRAVRFKKNWAVAHGNLGAALARKGQLDAAIEEYREFIRINKADPLAHYNLGVALQAKGQLDEAVAELRRALALQPDLAMAQGKLRQAEGLVQLLERLRQVLQGKDQPRDAAERLGFARLCQQYRKEHALAVRFYREAFASQPQWAENLGAGDRYNAACAAALAGCGRGQNAADLDEVQRGQFRQQALEWLRAEREAWDRVLQRGPERARPAVTGRMQHWLGDPDFAGVRGPEALARLPEVERQPWQQLWADVADTLVRSQNQSASGKSPDGK